MEQTEHPYPELPDPRLGRSPGWLRLLLLLFAVALLVLATLMVRLPYIALEAGPTEDAAKLTRIEGGQTYSSKGSFHITTALVGSPEGVLVPDALKIGFDPKRDLIRRELIYPPDESKDETDQKHAEQMEESQHAAAVAALEELGFETEAGAQIRSITEGSKAVEVLRPGDVIMGVDGNPVRTLADLTSLVRAHPVGTHLNISVRREGQITQAVVETVESPETKGRPVLGVTVAQHRDMPFQIEIEAEKIGGPSAGLIFALSVYDLLEPADLTGGQTIAGTGTIDPTGKVGKVGAIRHKVRAAQKIDAKVFIVPTEDVEEARRAAAGTMRVIGVDTLKEALAFLRAR